MSSAELVAACRCHRPACRTNGRPTLVWQWQQAPLSACELPPPRQPAGSALSRRWRVEPACDAAQLQWRPRRNGLQRRTSATPISVCLGAASRQWCRLPADALLWQPQPQDLALFQAERPAPPHTHHATEPPCTDKGGARPTATAAASAHTVVAAVVVDDALRGRPPARAAKMTPPPLLPLRSPPPPLPPPPSDMDRDAGAGGAHSGLPPLTAADAGIAGDADLTLAARLMAVCPGAGVGLVEPVAVDADADAPSPPPLPTPAVP